MAVRGVLRIAGEDAAHVLRLWTEAELQQFVHDHAQQHVTALQPVVKRMTRPQPYDDVSQPVRANFVGMLIGDGTSGKNSVRLPLQVLLVAALLS